MLRKIGNIDDPLFSGESRIKHRPPKPGSIRKKTEQEARDYTACTENNDDLMTTFQRILLMLKRPRKN